jgi:signal transduction histidine kinase
LHLSSLGHRRLRVLAWLMLAATLFTAVVAATAIYHSWQNAVQREEKLLRGITHSLNATIERRLEAASDVLAELAAFAGAWPEGHLPSSGLVDSVMRHREPSARAIESFGIADEEGRLVGASGFRHDADAVARMAKAVVDSHARAGSDALVITPGIARKEEPERTAFVVSRRTPTAAASSFVTFATLPVGDLLAIVAESIKRDGGRVTILSGEFRVVARLPHASLGADLSRTPIALMIRNHGGAGILRARSTIDGRPLLTAFVSSAAFPLHIAMSKDEDSVFAAWLDEQLLEFALLALLFAGTLGANVALHRTMRRQLAAEQVLRESQQLRYQHGLEGARDGLAIWDRGGMLVIWNGRFGDMANQLFGELDRATTFMALLRRVAARVVTGIAPAAFEEWCARHADAHRKAEGLPIEIVLSEDRVFEVAHQRASNGDTVTTLRDVSAERAAQQRIATGQARFRDGIDSMGEGFVLWDRDDRLVACNQRAIELLPLQAPRMREGVRYEDIIAHLEQLAPQQRDPEAWLAHLARRRRRREMLGVAELFRTGGSRMVEAVDQPTSDGGVVSIFRDVTEQHALLDRLRESEADLRRALTAEREMNEQQRRFVAMASHEFRTPLAIIDSASQRLLAQGRSQSAGDATKRLDRIRASVSRMTEIIDRTLVSARLDEGRIDLSFESFDLPELAREVVQRQLSITPDFGLTVAAPAAGLQIEADRRLIEHVLTNLISNAVKYSGSRRRAELRISELGDEVVLAVQDHGVGIPKHEIERLFTRFFRASTAVGIGGTGIGLHLVREFVGLHGGWVDVRSEVGVGSTFTVRLPRRRRSASVA